LANGGPKISLFAVGGGGPGHRLDFYYRLSSFTVRGASSKFVSFHDLKEKDRQCPGRTAIVYGAFYF